MQMATPSFEEVANAIKFQFVLNNSTQKIVTVQFE